MPELASNRLSRFVFRADVRHNTLKFLRRRLWYEFLMRFADPRLDAIRPIGLDGDLRMKVCLREPIDRSIYLYGTYEYRTVSAFKGFLRRGMVVVDAGAHHGLYTLIAAKRVGVSGRVLAVEPDAIARERLAENIALNDLRNVVVVSSALSDAVGEAGLYRPARTALDGQASLRAEWQGFSPATCVNVPTEPLDSLLERFGSSRLDVIKLDVEGFEVRALRGGQKAIEREHPVIIFEVNDIRRRGAMISAPAIDLLREWGYQIHGIVPGQGGPCKLRQLDRHTDPEDYREPWLALNLVAIYGRGQREPDRQPSLSEVVRR